MKKLFVCLSLLFSLTLTACSSVNEAFDLDEYWEGPSINTTQGDSRSANEGE